ncbi:MAG: OmpA family protein [Cytophagaceae bacterium]|nr:OmpA family protein [Cytophagaceae bacterium]
MVYRIHTLVVVMRGAKSGDIGMANKVNAFIFPVFFFVGLALFYWSYQSAKPYFLPEAASEHGKITDGIFWEVMLILLIAFLVTNVLLYVFPFLYQYKEGKKAYFYPDNHKLEMVWTVIPALVMAFFVVFGLIEWNKIFTFPEESKCEVIEIMGKQFAWQVRYPGQDNTLGKYKFKEIDATNEFGIDLTDKASFDDFIPRELHIPKGKPVLLRIRARDVLHSVFLPHFRVKMDAVPGMPTKFWFVPTKTTAEMRAETGNPKFNYELACTEICGRGHFAMRFLVVVDDSADYEVWKKKQNPWVNENADYVRTKVPGFVAPGEEVKTTTPVAPVIVDTVNVVEELTKKGEVSLHINFASGSSDLTDASMPSVKSIFEFLTSDKKAKIEISGHTDNSGDAKKNKDLSKQRAQAIVDALVKLGIAKKRLEAKGFGAEKPVADNATEEGKAQNRRVEIKKI